MGHPVHEEPVRLETATQRCMQSGIARAAVCGPLERSKMGCSQIMAQTSGQRPQRGIIWSAGHDCQLQQSRPPAAVMEVAMGTTRVVMHQLVLPATVDLLGICFGGQVCMMPHLLSPAASAALSVERRAIKDCHTWLSSPAPVRCQLHVVCLRQDFRPKLLESGMPQQLMMIIAHPDLRGPCLCMPCKVQLRVADTKLLA